MKKEKEKEPEKAEKLEITSYKKKFLEEKKDSDDSDEVTVYLESVLVYFLKYIFLNIFYKIYFQLFLWLQEAKPDVPKLSKKKLRRMNRLTVAELKQVNTQTGQIIHNNLSCPL